MTRPFRLKHPEPTEAQVQASVLALLNAHPLVDTAYRMNSGATKFKDDKGRERYVKFHTLPGAPDIMGWLRDGRVLGVECKRPSWRGPSDEREREQERTIEKIRSAGGVAFFARRPDDVIAHLGGVAA